MIPKIKFFSILCGAVFILLQMAFFAPKLQGQDICLPASCGQVELELIRQETNVSAQCPTVNSTCNSNNFHQVTYKAYLRYSDSQLPTQGTFSLAYSEIHIGLKLVELSNPQFSHFDAVATQCLYNNSPQGIMWNALNTGDEVIFEPTENRIGINFQNESTTSACGTSANGGSNRIQMQSGRPPLSLSGSCPTNKRCFYAELFTVVVNTYPGETVRFDTDTRFFKPYGSTSGCDITKVVVGSTSGFFDLAVAMPSLFSTSPINTNIVASLAVGIPDADGNEIVNVVLTNTNIAAVNVNFLEFVVTPSITNNSGPLDFTGIEPDEVEVTVQGSLVKYLRYTIQNPFTVNGGGGTVIISTIKIPPPIPTNLSWNYCFNLNNPQTFRIQTATGGCTSLNVNAQPACKTIPGDTPCSSLALNFTISPGEISCGTSTVNVGFRTDIPSAQYQLESLEFILDFTWTSNNISFSGLNFSSGLPFDNMDCETNGCFSNNNVQSCHTWDPVNKRLSFCLSNGPYYLNLPDLNAVTMGLVFNTQEGQCITDVEVNSLLVAFSGGFTNVCVPVVDPTDAFEICGGDLTDMVQGLIKTELSEGVEEVTVNFEAATGGSACPALVCQGDCGTPAPTFLTGDLGEYMFSCEACPNCNRFKVKPAKNDNPLNGVTTYDLVLISKHILGITPLSSSYNMIAADANKGNDITTFDIVELRKLILGTYQNLPNNTSWRFFDKSKQFTDIPTPPAAPNPFVDPIGEWEIINCIELPTFNLDFVAVKIGDVNNTVSPNRPEKRPVSYISWPALRPVAGEIITLPVYYEGEKTLEALQMGLRFDPAKLRFLGASQGEMDSYLPGNFHVQPELGQIRTLWLPMNEDWENIAPHTLLYHLSFEAIDNISGTLPMQLDNALLDAAAWTTDGQEFSLEQSARVRERSEQASELIATLRPTPTAGHAFLSIESQTSEPCRIAIYDAFGQQLVLKEITLDKGRHDILLQEAEGLPKGVYMWKVFTHNAKTQGHLIKI